MDYIKVKSNSNTWSDVKTTYVKTNTGWKPVKLMYTKIDTTTWIPMIPGNTPTIFKVTPNPVPAINNTSAITTISGSNFTPNMIVQIAYIPSSITLQNPIIKNITGSALTVINEYTLKFATPKGYASASGQIVVINSQGIPGNILPYAFSPNYKLTISGTTVSVNTGFYNGRLTVTDRISGVRRIQLNLNGVGSFTIPTRVNFGNMYPFEVIFPDGHTVKDLINIGRTRQ
jgi:hypothetical protein